MVWLSSAFALKAQLARSSATICSKLLRAQFSREKFYDKISPSRLRHRRSCHGD